MIDAVLNVTPLHVLVQTHTSLEGRADIMVDRVNSSELSSHDATKISSNLNFLKSITVCRSVRYLHLTAKIRVANRNTITTLQKIIISEKEVYNLKV